MCFESICHYDYPIFNYFKANLCKLLIINNLPRLDFHL